MRTDMQQMLREIGAKLGLELHPADSYDGKLKAVTEWTPDSSDSDSNGASASESSDEFFFDKNCYWRSRPNGEEPDGPYCTRCKDGEEKRVRMHRGGNPAWAICPVCDTRSEVWPEERPPKRGPSPAIIGAKAAFAPWLTCKPRPE